MKSRLGSGGFVTAVMLAASCAIGCGIPTDSALFARAPSDLSCPRANLTTRTTTDALGHGKTVVVEGCGRRQTYVAVCNGNDLGSTCAWMRDGVMEAVPTVAVQ